MWPGRPALSASTAAVPASATSRPASTSAGSRLPWIATLGPRRVRASVSVVRQSSPITLGPAEVGEHATRVGEHETLVVRRRQGAGPRVEDLEGAGAGVELQAHERHG